MDSRTTSGQLEDAARYQFSRSGQIEIVSGVLGLLRQGVPHIASALATARKFLAK